MICQECQKRPATMHFTKIVNGEKTEIHLCEECAKENGDIFMFNHSPALTFNNILANLFNMSPSIQHADADVFQAHDLLQCTKCGLTFQQFLNIGKFGCSHCYETFKDQLTPLLKRLHGGNWNHGGKIPKRAGGTVHLRKRIEALKERLQKLVEREEFEEAAKVRDEIKYYEKQLFNREDGE
ncbi:UvrB/UvrC motif-containing protein [Caldibacillus debilis]|uniref:UvrB/UvrC motif-containing protein n=1 Tax=Caldibacillus debilis TaxID=301148 RepID=UPI000B55D78A|nr:UvrB/UvrC motif-containing protein [Caldibacillus debilis]OUM91195.1 MAG: hypothetical protein BAA03_02180 [Caldibacillus debilis]REJ30109.1 MAG: hypothetical protein C6W56_04500 [Caldibacillus debilis]